ncbi:hypothetical protein B0H11DRAFT_1912185 [Mycena galericulata]|nr:hypothetical protein B0H11DRAFT_1912185 [Mycena galericulata]
MSYASLGKIHTYQDQRDHKQPYNVSISTIGNLGQEVTAQNDKNHRLTRRALCKILRDGSEPVWPPHLRVLTRFNIGELIIIHRETALLEGLYAHALLCAEQGRDLRRETHRNKYISEHIFRTTNKKRSMKQVSSRLQQLASASKDVRLTSILLNGYVPEAVVKSLASELSCAALNTSELGFTGRTIRLPVTIVSTSARYPSLVPEVMLGELTQTIQLRTMTGFEPHTHIRRGMDPTIILISPIQLASRSTWEVYREKKPYWTTSTMLVPTGVHEGRYQYSTSIAADLWDVISADVNFLSGECIEWMIVHSVFHLEDGPNHPFAELVYTFERLISEATLQEDGHNYRKDPFRYMRVVCPPSNPTAQSIFFPGTPSPKKDDMPPILGTFVDEKMELILSKRMRRPTKKSLKKSLKPSPDIHSNEDSEMIRNISFDVRETPKRKHSTHPLRRRPMFLIQLFLLVTTSILNPRNPFFNECTPSSRIFTRKKENFIMPSLPIQTILQYNSVIQRLTITPGKPLTSRSHPTVVRIISIQSMASAWVITQSPTTSAPDLYELEINV